MYSSRMRTAHFNGHLGVGVICLWVWGWLSLGLGDVHPPGQTPPAHCILGYTYPPPPPDRILDTCLWKHYLPATTFEGSNHNRYFGCPIIYTDLYSQYYFVLWHLNNAWYKQAHSVIRAQYLAIIASNVVWYK